MAFGFGCSLPARLQPNLLQQAVTILKSYGTNAHVYLPGIGTINGLTAGNYLDSALTTQATVDGLIGGVVDSLGAINATAAGAARPTLRRGLVNLLTYSNDLSNAAWTKTATSISGNKILETAATGTHNVAENASVTIGNPYTIAVECSAAERNYIGVYAGTPGQGVIFNLTTGAYYANLVGAPTSYSITQTGTGTYLCVINYTASGAVSAPSVYVCDGTGAFSYTGDITKGINVQKIGHFTGTLTASQILAEGGIPLTTSAAASNASAGRYSAQYSGAQSLTLGSVPFQMADDHAVIAGALCDSATGVKIVYSGYGAASQRCGQLYWTGGILTAGWVDDSVFTTVVSEPISSVNSTVVASLRKVSNNKILRKNGAQQGVNTAAMGVTTLTAAALGSHQVTPANFMTGSIGPVIAIKGTVTDADLLTLERFVSSMTPNGPSF